MWLALALAADVGPVQPPYAEQVAAIEARRRTVDRDRAREELFDAITGLMPRWRGTPWSFGGDAEEPGAEPVACGYYVSVVLRDAGLRVERRRLAQQAAEHIIETLVPPAHIARFRNRSAEEVVRHVARRDGVYVVGLDYHVGFLVVREGAVAFCHSNFLDDEGPVCEDPLTAPAFASRYRVTGELLVDPVVDGWREGRSWQTVTR